MFLEYKERHDEKKSILGSLIGSLTDVFSSAEEAVSKIKESFSGKLIDRSNDNPKIDIIQLDGAPIPIEEKPVEVQTNLSKKHSTSYEYGGHDSISSLESSSNNRDYNGLNSEKKTHRKKKRRHKSINVENDNSKELRKNDFCQIRANSYPIEETSNAMMAEIGGQSEAKMADIGEQVEATIAEIQRQSGARMAEMGRQSEAKMADIGEQVETTIAEIQRQSGAKMAEIIGVVDSILANMKMAEKKEQTLIEAREKIKNDIKNGQSVKDDKHIEDCVRFAAHVYGTYSDNILPKGCKVIDSIYDANTGLKAKVYSLDRTTAICAFAGTQSAEDWWNNVTQVFGLSSQYEQALEYAKSLQKKFPQYQISFVGHSQGGGEAAYCALNMGAEATTFNPAGLSHLTKLKGKSQFSRFTNVQAYIFWNDILNNLQDYSAEFEEITMIPTSLKANGHVHYINDFEPQGLSIGEYHGMKGILRYFGIQ